MGSQPTARRSPVEPDRLESVDTLLGPLRRAFAAGDWPHACTLYTEGLAFDRGTAAAHFEFGVMAAEVGEDALAVDCFSRAVRLVPDNADAWDNLCVVLTRRGRMEEAVEAGRTAVRLNPSSAAAQLNFGTAQEGVGEMAAAARSFEAAAALEPLWPAGPLKLANALRRLREFDVARQAADLCLTRDPRSFGAYVIRAMIGVALGRLEEADHDFATARRLCPVSSEALNHLGVICLDQGRSFQAIEILTEAARLGPASAEPHGNLGLALQRQGRTREAFGAYVKAVTIEPTHAVAQCNLAGLLIEIGEFAAAVSTCRLAIQADPRCVEARVYLGIALRRGGHPAEALCVLTEAIEQKPDAGDAIIEICDIRQQTCDWPGLAAAQEAARNYTYRVGKRVPPFQVLALTASAEDHRDAARLWGGGFRAGDAPLAPYAPRPPHRRRARLRIGYLSADFRTHATAMLVAELFERHDRSRFELFGYSCGLDDASLMRGRLVAALDHFIDIRSLSHLDAARRMQADGLDILIDLKGYTRDGRPEILVQRPAPIQVNYLGYPGTMGAGFIDYIIADAVVAPPEHAGFFDEKIVRLPHSYQPNDSLRAMAQRPTRFECGLPETGFVFCCLNSSYKITPILFDIWMRLLSGLPGSVLWLFEGDGSATANLRREAAARAVDPARLVFAPHILPEAHLARLELADLFLDTLPVNAHTTASEALWAGLPVLTCAGEAFASRVAASLLRAVGLEELVTASLPAYEALAASLARDPDRLGRLRAHLRSTRERTPLFDTPRYVRNFEAALARMAELRDLGLPPRAFTIEDLSP